MLGQTRVFYAMSRDGLIGGCSARCTPGSAPRTSRRSSRGSRCPGVGPPAAPDPGAAGEDRHAAGVRAGMRRVHRPAEDAPRPPAAVQDALGAGGADSRVLACVGLMATLPLDTWLRLAVWLAIGLVIYFATAVPKHAAAGARTRSRAPSFVSATDRPLTQGTAWITSAPSRWPTSGARRAASSASSPRPTSCCSASAPSSAPASSCSRAGGGAVRRAGHRPLVRPGRGRLPLRRPLLRRVRVDDPDRRQRLHLRLRDAGRARRLDHRLGPDPRVPLRRLDGRGRLVGLLHARSWRELGIKLPPALTGAPFSVEGTHTLVRSQICVDPATGGVASMR